MCVLMDENPQELTHVAFLLVDLEVHEAWLAYFAYGGNQGLLVTGRRGRRLAGASGRSAGAAVVAGDPAGVPGRRGQSDDAGEPVPGFKDREVSAGGAEELGGEDGSEAGHAEQGRFAGIDTGPQFRQNSLQ